MPICGCIHVYILNLTKVLQAILTYFWLHIPKDLMVLKIHVIKRLMQKAKIKNVIFEVFNITSKSCFYPS